MKLSWNAFKARRRAQRERLHDFQEKYYRKLMDNPHLIRDSRGRKAAGVPKPPLRWIVFGVSMFWVTILGCYSMAYGVLQLVYQTWFPDIGHPFGRQLLTVAVMLLLLGTIIMLVRLVFDPGRQQITTFILMMDAMRRMAKGDFNVTLEMDPKHAGQFGVLIKSFNEMATELGQMEAMRQEFISNVSHEFQSPLTSIGGFARALQNDQLPEDTRRHYLRIIIAETERLSKLSDNLLKLTSLEKSHHPFEPTPYPLDRQIRRVILSCEPQWRAKRLEIEVELPRVMILADADLIGQVWTNLIHNAIKFTPEDGWIRVNLEFRGDRCAVIIANSGPPIDAEDLPRLFERFYKADKARSREGGGSGLGLAIVKRIVDLHEGETFVESSPDTGTAFTVLLPKVTERPILEGPSH